VEEEVLPANESYFPSIFPLSLLTLTYVGMAVTPQVAILLVYEITDNFAKNKEIEKLAVPIAISWLSYGLPFLLTLIYMATGSDFILVAWLDEVLVFLI